MIKTHFEIGVKHENETQTVFSADSLGEWHNKGYTIPNYFIDIWESKLGHPYPIGVVCLCDDK